MPFGQHLTSYEDKQPVAIPECSLTHEKKIHINGGQGERISYNAKKIVKD